MLPSLNKMYAVLSNWCRRETVNSETVDGLAALSSVASHYCKSTQQAKHRVALIEKLRTVVSADHNCSSNVNVENKTMIISVFFLEGATTGGDVSADGLHSSNSSKVTHSCSCASPVTVLLQGSSSENVCVVKLIKSRTEIPMIKTLMTFWSWNVKPCVRT